jgi:replication factor A1
MKVADLRPDAKVDTIDLTIVDKGDTREFTSRYGASGRVCDAKGRDEDGDEVSVTLWNEEIEQVNVNDRIRITNGWVRQFRGDLQVSAGRYGKLEIL